MRNLKKFLALVLATLMVVSAAATVSAYAVFDDVEDGNQYAEAIGRLVEYNITNGIGDSLFGVDNEVERYQMALFMARALNPDETDWQSGIQVFEDVNEWFGAIAFARAKGIVFGVDATHFAPHDGIKYQDALIMVLRALGYNVDTTGDPYWLAAYQQAADLGLTKNIAVNKGVQILTRAETAQVICNMLDAKPADGGLTIAQKNFIKEEHVEPEIKLVKDEITYVITATPKQAYAKGDNADVLAAGFVGIQPLINGVPDGSVRYISVDALGIEKADVENYFNYAVSLYNHAEDDGIYVTCDKAELVASPDKVYAKDVAKVSGSKIKVDGTVYTITDAYTGSNVRNEIVILNGASAGKRVQLLTDEKGNIIKANGTKIAMLVVAQDGSKFYAYTDEDGNDKLISESEALNKFGIEVGANFTKFETLNTYDSLGKNYELTMFDDNDDGIYDRAFCTTVYMSVYNTNKSDGTSQIVGLTSYKDVGGLTGLNKGDVFTYTYNAATNSVNVLEVLAPQSGVINKINTSNANEGDASKSTYKSIVVTIDGKDYVLANSDRITSGHIGAVVNTSADTIDYEKIAEKGAMNLVKLENLVIGDTTKFIAYGDTIIAAKSIAAGDPYKVAVMKSVDTIDGKTLVVSAYINGELKNDLKVTAVTVKVEDESGTVTEKTTKFADLSDLGFTTTVVSYATDNLKTGKLFQVRENTVEGTVTLKETDAAAEYKQTVNLAGATKATFKTGIADTFAFAGTAVTDAKVLNANAIRTNSSTIIYFIGNDGVKVLKGSLADGKSINLNKANVYTDLLGFGADSNVNGVSGTIVVISKDEDDNDVLDYKIENLTDNYVADTTTNAVMILGESALTYVQATASTFGLSGSDVYRAYNVNAIDLASGSAVSTVYVKNAKDAIVPEIGKVYNVKKGTTVIESEAVEGTNYWTLDNVDTTTFIPARVWNISGLTTASAYHKIATVTLTGDNKYEIKAIEKLIEKDNTYTITYVTGANATEFIGVVTKNAAGSGSGNTDTNKVTVNAQWTGPSGSKYAAVANVTEATTKKVVGTAYVAAKTDAVKWEDSGWFTTLEDVTAWTGLKSADYTAPVVEVSNKDGKVDGFKVTVDIKDGVASFTIVGVTTTDVNGSHTTEIPTGDITVKISFANASNKNEATDPSTFYFAVKGIK